MRYDVIGSHSKSLQMLQITNVINVYMFFRETIGKEYSTYFSSAVSFLSDSWCIYFNCQIILSVKTYCLLSITICQAKSSHSHLDVIECFSILHCIFLKCRTIFVVIYSFTNKVTRNKVSVIIINFHINYSVTL